MKTTYKYLLLAGLVVLAASCEKEIEKESPADATTGKMITETISAQIDEATKATVDADAKFAWTVGDNIAVHVSNGNYVVTSGEGGASVAAASASFTVSYPGGTTRDAFAIFPSTIVETDAANYGQDDHTLDVTLPSTYTLAQVSGTATPCPMIATNAAGSGWTFRQLCGLLRLTISGIPTGTYSLKLDFNGRKVSGDFAIASTVTPGTSTIASIAGTKGTDDFITITGITTETSVTVNIPLPTGAAYADLVVSAWDNSATPVALKAAVEHFTYEAANAKGKKFTSELNKEIFTVGSGKYAVFAPANLVATITEVTDGVPTAATWTFAASQYILERSTHTEMEEEKEIVYQDFGVGKKIDTFAWVGKSSTYYDGPLTQYGVNLTHKASNQKLDDGTYPCGNGYTEKIKIDWGQNTISGYTPGVWRAVVGGTDGEFDWVIGPKDDPTPGINCRTGSRFEKARIEGIKGILIFPDNYNHPIDVDELIDINGYKTAWNSTQEFSADDLSKMEAAGVVFLGTVGVRQGNTFSELAGNYIYYWAGNHSVQFWMARDIVIGGANVYPANDTYRHNGLPVRLICPLN